MSSLKSRSESPRDEAGVRGLRVTNWPLRDNPVGVSVVALGCVLIAIGTGVVSGSVPMAMLALLALTLSLWQLWIPITTEFDPRGIVLTLLGQRRRIAWQSIDHLELHEAGVFLCAGPQSARRAALDTIFLPWGKDRESISSFCQNYRPLTEQEKQEKSHPLRTVVY